MMMPPRNWLVAVLALRMRPQSNEPRKRLMRVSPVTALTRASQNIAPYECMDQCCASIGGGAAASTTSWSRCARARIET